MFTLIFLRKIRKSKCFNIEVGKQAAFRPKCYQIKTEDPCNWLSALTRLDHITWIDQLFIRDFIMFESQMHILREIRHLKIYTRSATSDEMSCLKWKKKSKLSVLNKKTVEFEKTTFDHMSNATWKRPRELSLRLLLHSTHLFLFLQKGMQVTKFNDGYWVKMRVEILAANLGYLVN